MALMLVATPEPAHLDAPALAALIRADLKAAFPAVKFSVRSSRYAGGSSVHVSWTDGPLASAVDAAIDRYKAQGFDGMTDSATNRGPVRLADGRLVRIYSYLSTQRSTSPALRARVQAWMDRNPEKAADPSLGALSVHEVAHRACLLGVHLAVVPWHVRLA